MNKQLILVASLALVLSGSAFAQTYSTPANPPPATQATPPTDDQTDQAADQTAQTNEQAADQTEQATEQAADQTAQATEQANEQNADEQQAPPSPPATKAIKRVAAVSKPAPMSGNAAVLAPSVPPVISASAPQPTAANHYDPRKDLKTKVYPTTDKGHAAGDPPVIDHTADIAPVANPTTSVAAVPPAG